MGISRYRPRALGEDDQFVLYRGWSAEREASVILKGLANAADAGDGLRQLEDELAQADKLCADWAAMPLALELDDGGPVLILSDEGGEPLGNHLGKPFEVERFLVVASNAAAALRNAHAVKVVHKSVRPGNLLVDPAGRVWLTGFGRAGAATSKNQPAPASAAEVDLAYISPEQTGRVKLGVDARSDLYSLGVVFYQMLTGELPFVAIDAVEWIHAHVARQPVPPGQLHDGVSPMLQAIIMKLLAKKPEQRYQTAVGLEADLKRCLDDWRKCGHICFFGVATDDAGDRISLPQRLYGRAGHLNAILAALERVRSSGTTEVVLISGPAGVGKSSIVQELREGHLARYGMFAFGKFDQYSRDIPYATIAQAFRALVRQILGYQDAELSRWRKCLLEALGPNGRLMVTLVPELALIIGEQPSPPDLPFHEARARFHLVFSRFLSAFAMPGRPLVLFVDDVQWLDAATIELLGWITSGPDAGNLLLICAYRDDEVFGLHPFIAAREAMRGAGIHIQEQHLSALGLDDLKHLLADVLQLDSESVVPLAEVVLDKTEGNPFYSLQFLTAMEAEGLVTFDALARAWTWDPDRIRTKGITENVAEIVSSKILRLPRMTLDMVKLLACLGSAATSSTLSLMAGKSKQQVASILWDAVQERILLNVDDGYSFAHDRIREAVYLLIPEHERPKIHIYIGRALIAGMPAADLQGGVFEVCDQIGRGLGLIDSELENEQIAGLFLDAGVRAKTSAAYSSALRYFTTGLSLLLRNRRQPSGLMFALELQKAECEFLTGEHVVAEGNLLSLVSRATSQVDAASAVRLLSSLYVALGEQAKAVDVGLAFLRKIGIDWSAHPGEADLQSAVQAMKRLLAGRDIEQLVGLPRMMDPECLATMDVLAYMILPALLTDSNLEDLIYIQMVNLSLTHGNCDASCYAYASLIVPVGLRFGDYRSGCAFGDLALVLVDEHGLDRFRARVYTCYSCYVVPWGRHLPESIPLTRRAIDVALASGDLVYAATIAKSLVSNLLVSGQPLQVVENEALRFLELAKRAGFGLAAESAIGQLLLVRELRGNTGDSDDLPDKPSFLARLRKAGAPLVLPLAWFWIQEVQACFMNGNYEAAVEAEAEARVIIGATRSFIDLGEYHFYGALAHAAVCTGACGDKRLLHLQSVYMHHRQIGIWAESCPENFSNRLILVTAEIARLEGRELEAFQLYERAAASAKRYGFVQIEAIANELASQLYNLRGLATSSEALLRKAREGYTKWGALGKVRRMDFPGADGELRGRRALPTPIGNHLDMLAVMEMSQAVSGEILLDRLMERLMTTVVEYSGAVRGLLLLTENGKTKVVAEAVTEHSGVSVLLSVAGEVAFPGTIVSYVSHTREVVILDDAKTAELFSGDVYLRQAASASILCLPLVKQQQLVGILYLENNLSSHLFTEGQVAVLQLLASQAAISLENAALYLEAQETQERARRIAEEVSVTYDMIPALAWKISAEGTDPVFNKQWHEYTGITPADAREAWLMSFHPDDREKIIQKWTQCLLTGNADEAEARIVSREGVSRSFLVRVRPVRDDAGKILKWVGTSTDIDDLKRAEEAQELLARAGRFTALGELTASIAHEINQPLMAIVMNAATCLRWLNTDQLDVGEAREAAERIIVDGHRAGDVIKGIRALATKSRLKMEEVDVNVMIQDVIVLARGELQRQGINLEKFLSQRAGYAFGDRIQLQQVVLNLILNAVEALGTVENEPRRLKVTSERSSDGKVTISVADSGPGIESEKLDKVFEAFFTSKPGGLGMGLSICRSIVENHEGRIWMTPNKPHGCIFSFSLRAVAT